MALEDVWAGPLVVFNGAVGGTLTTLGITEGGVAVEIEGETRDQVVDDYGSSPIDVIHVGDRLEVAADVAEWLRPSLEEAFYSGLSAAAMIGIGRRPGWKYSANQFSCSVQPLQDRLNGAVDRYIIMWRAVGGLEAVSIGGAKDEDAKFRLRLRALVDENQADGELLGRIYAPAS